MESHSDRITCDQLNEKIKAGAPVKILDACLTPGAEKIFKTISIPGSYFFKMADVRDKSNPLPNTFPTSDIVTQRCREL